MSAGLNEGIQLQLPKLSFWAFDPGERTGVVRIVNGKIANSFIWDFNTFLYEISPSFGKGLIVYESFRLYGHKAKTMTGNEMVSAQIIGMLKLISYKGKGTLVHQTAQEAKQRCSNEVLKRYGFYAPSSEDHAKDAARHALCYLIKEAAKTR